MIEIPICKDRNVAVFGLSRTGLSAVKSLIASGANVFAWDDNKESRDKLADISAPNLHIIDPEGYDWEHLDFLILSPGIPLTHPEPHSVVQKARKGTMIISDIELLYFADPAANFIGITGTNGKSTTTALTGHILKECEVKSAVGGNIGEPVLSLDKLGQGGNYVIEMSSYQLDLIKSTRFNISVFLNITPDHLDRHGDMQGYIEAKKHIYDNQSEQDVAIIGIDDEYTKAIYEELKANNNIGKIIPISVNSVVDSGICVKDGKIIDGDKEYSLGELKKLAGVHNAQNIAAAYAVAKNCDLEPEQIIEAIKTFEGLPHRMQYIAQKDGITFINDSKATNAEAAAKALATYENIYWIAGGVAKEGGISSLGEFFPKIKHAYLIGQAADEFADSLSDKVKYTNCGDLQSAIKAAHSDAKKEGGEAVILLSPACASFDQWQSFEHRGDAFIEMVKSL